eukprot:s2093_g3.t1
MESSKKLPGQSILCTSFVESLHHRTAVFSTWNLWLWSAKFGPGFWAPRLWIGTTACTAKKSGDRHVDSHAWCFHQSSCYSYLLVLCLKN